AGWEAWGAGRLYKSGPEFGVFAALALGFSRRTVPIALLLPGLLAPLQAELPTAFPQALNPAVGVVGLLLALVGLLRRGLAPPRGAAWCCGAARARRLPPRGWGGCAGPRRSISYTPPTVGCWWHCR